MGLDTTHGCFSGPYPQFMRWRRWVASQVGIPIDLMEGFYRWRWDETTLTLDADYKRIAQPPERFAAIERSPHDFTLHWETLEGFRSIGKPLPWSILGDNPLVTLLDHSDCNGKIVWWECKPIALALWKILKSVPDDTSFPVHSETGDLMWDDWRKGRGVYDGYVPATKRFIVGLLNAYKAREHVVFG